MKTLQDSCLGCTTSGNCIDFLITNIKIFTMKCDVVLAQLLNAQANHCCNYSVSQQYLNTISLVGMYLTQYLLRHKICSIYIIFTNT